MDKKKILIWGGNRKALTLENLDSHASVSAYFLSKYLSDYYDIIHLYDMDAPEELLQYAGEVSAMISTFQYGFTSRMVNKGKGDLFNRLRKEFNGPLCSIVDFAMNRPFCEDILFTVLPLPTPARTAAIARKCSNSTIRFACMGWSADAAECYPVDTPDSQINVFVDHPPYAGNVPDCSHHYYNAFKQLQAERSDIELNVYQQNNSGVVKWDFDDSADYDGGQYERSKKMAWKDIADYYRKIHVFCSTHPESAGLSSIEAAMCGAVLYVPYYRMCSCFVTDRLWKPELAVRTFRYWSRGSLTTKAIVNQFHKDLEVGFNRNAIHERLAVSNSWKTAAEKVRNVLVDYMEETQ